MQGLSIDYLIYSVLGYAAYTVYTAALYWSPGVQAAYISAHAGSAPDVCLADFLFAAHATVCTMFTVYQCHLYGGNSSSSSSSSIEDSRIAAPAAAGLATSQTCRLTALGTAGAIVAYASHIGTTCGVDDCDAWLPLLLMLGITKVTMTLIKYTPQVRLLLPVDWWLACSSRVVVSLMSNLHSSRGCLQRVTHCLAFLAPSSLFLTGVKVCTLWRLRAVSLTA